jgi:DNA-binding MarR family transcriptional regulator
MLDKLESKGLLGRQRNENDRRVVDLKLTDSGRQMAELLPDIVPDVMNARLRDFSEQEFNEFRRLLIKFVGRE